MTYPAQERFAIGLPSPYGASVAGVVPLVLDSSGNPQPISSINPLPVTGGGGGGGGSMQDMPLIDANGQQFFFQDTGSGITGYKLQNGSYVAYTPTAPWTLLPNSNQSTVTAQNSQTTLLAQIEANTATSSGNAAAGPVGSALPAYADYQGWNNGGTLVGNTLTTPMPVSLAAAYFIQSGANSSTSQLAAGATFTGTIDSILNQPNVSLNIPSDQPLVVTLNQFESTTANSIISSWQYQVPAGQGFNQAFSANGNSFQIIVTNIGTAATTTLVVNTYYGTITPVDQGGNGQVAVYGSGDLQGVNLLEAAIRGDLALSTKPINQPATDVNNALILSDCPAPVRLLASTAGQAFVIDTQGYPTLSLTMGTMQATLTGSNDLAGSWATVEAMQPSAASATATLANTGGYIVPCAFRYLRLVVTTAGWATYNLRNIQSSLGNLMNLPVNITMTGGTASAAPAGQLAIGYTTASNGETVGTFLAPATTSTTQQLKATAGKITFLSASNPNTTAAWLKLFNLPSASVTLGTTSATMDVMIPIGGTLNIDLGDTGLSLGGTGITVAMTGAQGVTNNTGLVLAGQINYAYI